MGLRPVGPQAGGPPGAPRPSTCSATTRRWRSGAGTTSPSPSTCARASPLGDTRTAIEFVSGQELPSWNRSILDARIKRTLERADGTRPVIAHSGIAPHLPQLDGTDSHLYFGWYHGEERDLPAFAAAWPRMVRFVSEFGAQAVPADAAFMEPERWPDLDWERLQEHHALQKVVFDERVPPADHETFDGWQQATQRYQARLLRHHIEALRRLKYRPAGGFSLFSLADAIPAVTWSLLGHDRAAKLAYHVVAEACRPVIVVADRMPAGVAPGETLALDVHVVSDRRGADRGRHHLGRPVVAGRRPGLAVAGRHPGRRLRPGRDRPGRRAGDVRPARARPRPRGGRRRGHEPLREPHHRDMSGGRSDWAGAVVASGTVHVRFRIPEPQVHTSRDRGSGAGRPPAQVRLRYRRLATCAFR